MTADVDEGDSPLNKNDGQADLLGTDYDDSEVEL